MFPYLSFIVNLYFNVVGHLVDRSMKPSDVAHSTPTDTLVLRLDETYFRRVWMSLLGTSRYEVRLAH